MSNSEKKLKLRSSQKAALVAMVAELEDKEDWSKDPDQALEMQFEFSTSLVNTGATESGRKTVEIEIQDCKLTRH